jgi:MFS family permease
MHCRTSPKKCTMLVALHTMRPVVYLATVLHLTLTSPLYIAGVSLPWIVQGLALFACGSLADRAIRRAGSARTSRVLLAGVLLFLGAIFLYLAVNIPSTPGAVTSFILAATAWAATPLLAAIVLDMAPQAHRGSSRGSSWPLPRCQVFLLHS